MRVSILFLLFFNQSLFSQISYSNFETKQVGTQISVSWQIDSGSTCNGIKIFRSSDGLNFNEIHFIDAVCGSSFEAKNYLFFDQQPLQNQLNIYRLFFGTSTYSINDSVFFFATKADEIPCFPNPASDKIQFRIDNPQSAKYSIKIFDGNGKECLSSESITEINEVLINNWLKGIYFIYSESENGTKRKGTFVKK